MLFCKAVQRRFPRPTDPSPVLHAAVRTKVGNAGKHLLPGWHVVVAAFRPAMCWQCLQRKPGRHVFLPLAAMPSLGRPGGAGPTLLPLSPTDELQRPTSTPAQLVLCFGPTPRQELTFLTKQEILLAHRRFSDLLPKEVREQAFLTRVPKSKLLMLPELRANPFRHRICHVFSTAEDGEGSMSFEDFLDMLSVFSDSATLEIKSHYAFRIFDRNPYGAAPVSGDFDDDGTLDKKDLEQLVNCLTGEAEDSRLTSMEMEQLIQNILEEADIDKDGTINLSEFQHIISRSPDFTSSFKIVL
ncbi:hypothetical protein JRQ81_006745 [Phrynocephalus forsythii]|uniref:EF-hand domain-containing protein n=1 Tax=Phrynocephalus forsythii TaxID=171643 RepID=A0A9Q0XFK5_9SAUR|nr:hypothetical protein JRQ81_006745 [Phrynocephalus forsythii]